MNIRVEIHRYENETNANIICERISNLGYDAYVDDTDDIVIDDTHYLSLGQALMVFGVNYEVLSFENSNCNNANEFFKK